MLLRLAAGFGLIALLSSTALAGTIEGPLQIIVSRDRQTLKVYDGETVVASSNVSSGKEGHATPTGIFSILEKKRMHHSNIYDDAPMPFMQRLTWSGIALHASGHVPAYPASHGCVRMPDDFARMLYRLTRRGGHVLVNSADVAPHRVEHPALFQPEGAEPEGQLLSDAPLRPTILGPTIPSLAIPVPTLPDPTGDSVEVAMRVAAPPAQAKPMHRPAGDPVRILITRATPRDTMKDLQALLGELGHDAGPADGVAGQQTAFAIKAFQTAEGMTADGTASPALIDAVFRKAGRDLPANGRLSVRKDFVTLLEAPVTIREESAELGTHFLLARTSAGGNDLDWFGVTMDNALSTPARKRLGIAEPGSFSARAPDPILEALGRIGIAAEVRGEIEGLVGDGASLTITDTGTEGETGKGTDFITLTRPGPAGSGYASSSARWKKESSIVVIE
ncbi:L,D-transpeptidase family protein [Rhizobium sp. TRM96647]|uniref:L,D-transpeptidase family protein n=1 Tax=unclassified Rhizobium TaxID=2613769 RepID=UPI0021E7CBAE|nr:MULTISPECIES: L,D-transpeptidase family protein [unclassified Rhizobium]MCV3738269.1 L,D-transpeptidase family protein [Rhizobium sp. TRM96647]MCV3759982.1 L,D-transpeptidase family protein [Rhizobium sp. TRM96650]